MEMENRIAVIDIGTNTFHLLIVRQVAGKLITLYRKKIPVKIGQGGIHRGMLTQDAVDRGIQTLFYFRTLIDEFNVTTVKATATSAVRNASNGKEFVERALQETGIHIDIISGEEEAQLIYEGVRTAVNMEDNTNLIMDIGGGSVEFIICDSKEVLWKQSFEIGGQRLYLRFHQTDPIASTDLDALVIYLEDELQSLWQATEHFKPKTLIGASGAFDTLCDIYHIKKGSWMFEQNKTEYALPLDKFHEISKDIVSRDRDDRLRIPGMITMRADLIVVACALIECVLQKTNIEAIKASTHSLKEGLIERALKTLEKKHQ